MDDDKENNNELSLDVEQAIRSSSVWWVVNILMLLTFLDHVQSSSREISKQISW